MELSDHIAQQIEWSLKTFGPGIRSQMVIEHIKKELKEIEAAPTDLEEWIDVIMLGIDGAWRTGASPTEISTALTQKLTKNKNRVWPDWRTAGDGPIEHDRSYE